MARVLVTTDYLGPGDEVHAVLTDAGHTVSYSPAAGARSAAEAAALFADVDAAIIASEPVTAQMLLAAPTLEVIARSGVGFDSIDTDTAARRGIWVCNTPGVNHHSVAEMTFGLMLSIARRLPTVIGGVEAGGWPREAGTELRGSTLGVVGYGPSGQAVADLGVAFGMKVLVSTAHPQPDKAHVQFTDLDTVIDRADYLTLHSRAAADTTPLIDADRLAQMKSSAVLINTARGSLVDESALASALDSGQISGAALDVANTEPLPSDSPLRGRGNVIITSHLAGQTAQARMRAGLAAADNILAVLDGREPPSPVNQPDTSALR